LKSRAKTLINKWEKGWKIEAKEPALQRAFKELNRQDMPFQTDEYYLDYGTVVAMDVIQNVMAEKQIEHNKEMQNIN